MIFNSLDDVISYINSICSTAMNPMGERMEEIMKNELMHQVYASYTPNQYERTGQLEDTPNIALIDSDSVTVEFQDNGDWKDVPSGNHAFPISRFEQGQVWAEGGGKNNPKYLPATNIMDESFSKCQSDIPPLLAEFLKSRGIPIK